MARHRAEPEPLRLIPRQRTGSGRHAAPPQPLKLPRPRTIAAAGLVVPVLASGAQDAVWHEPDATDLSTTTGSIQAVQTVPVQMSPTADVVEVPLPTAALSLSATREVLEAAQQAREEAARLEQERASREASAARVRHTAQPTPAPTRTQAPAPEPEPAAAPAAGGSRAAVVIAAAREQLGERYVYGGTGPDVWDCSGLTRFAYAQAGVSLPRTSQAQQAATRHIPAIQAQPGDLVFWGHPAWHVAIYLGGGMILAAPKPGDVVKIQPLWGSFEFHRVA